MLKTPGICHIIGHHGENGGTMIIQPKFRGFICTTAHPAGCKSNVLRQIEYVKSRGAIKGAKNALIIGSSAGFGLASRITAAYGCGARTFGVYYDRPPSEGKTATAGWYNNTAFEKQAAADGLYAKGINGDGFSNEVKTAAIDALKRDFGKIDLFIYSVATPRRTNPITGETMSSVIKPYGQAYTAKNVDFHTGQVADITIEPATEDELRQTVGVMGGEDWKMWVEALVEAGVADEGMVTLAYSYIGPELTHPIYKDGTIGAAKLDLAENAVKISEKYADMNIRAIVSVNKALVTQASSAIPVVPLYVAILFKVMKEKGIQEGTIEQMRRLFAERLYCCENIPVDENGFIRIDDLEMRDDVQKAAWDIWGKVDSGNI
jgi:enoyl-[acyl-carrier protein] reductase/trans-2-enoyl-CoA reductase (NAD+)